MKLPQIKSRRPANQRGFTLLEIIVALVLLGILAVAVVSAFDGSRSRAQSLLSQMNELQSANLRLKQDTGCYALDAALLFDPSKAATTGANTCAKSLSNVYNGPYMQTFQVSGTSVAIDKITPQATIAFLPSKVGTGSYTGRNIYVLEAQGVNADVAKAFLVECNGMDTTKTAFDGSGKCYGDPAAGKVQIVMDVTR